jgi:hypothetical protein
MVTVHEKVYHDRNSTAGLLPKKKIDGLLAQEAK